MIGSMSQGQPARWTATIALVRGVTTAEIVSAEILPLARSTSAKTGLAPALATQEIDAMKVRGRSEEHTSELQSLMRISYAVFCLKKKKITKITCMHNQTSTQEA